MLNALEYHRSSEANVAATDVILLLGQQSDITDDFKYDTAQLEAFFVPAGTAVELYATTLHYTPIGTKRTITHLRQELFYHLEQISRLE